MDRLIFLQRFFASPAAVGSLTPSSRFLVDRMLAPVAWDQCRAIAELGAGTGGITGQIRRRLPQTADFLVFERDPIFRRHLAERWPGLALHSDAAEIQRAMAVRGVKRLDAVISGLPFSLIPGAARAALLDQIQGALAPGGVFVAFQYSPHMLFQLQRRFRTVQVTLILRNLPPAFVYICKA